MFRAAWTIHIKCSFPGEVSSSPADATADHAHLTANTHQLRLNIAESDVHNVFLQSVEVQCARNLFHIHWRHFAPVHPLKALSEGKAPIFKAICTVWLLQRAIWSWLACIVHLGRKHVLGSHGDMLPNTCNKHSLFISSHYLLNVLMGYSETE